jgi:hypothetical protein
MDSTLILSAVEAVTTKWTRQRKAEERRQSRVTARIHALTNTRGPTIRYAAWKVMADAYQKASGGGRYSTPTMGATASASLPRSLAADWAPSASTTPVRGMGGRSSRTGLDRRVRTIGIRRWAVNRGKHRLKRSRPLGPDAMSRSASAVSPPWNWTVETTTSNTWSRVPW